MLLSMAGLMGVLWALGMVYGFRLGGAIHVLLAATIVMAFFGVRQWWRQPA